MKTHCETKSLRSLYLLAPFAILTLLCVGCQTFMTEEEWEKERVKERATYPMLPPGAYGSWKP